MLFKKIITFTPHTGMEEQNYRSAP